MGASQKEIGQMNQNRLWIFYRHGIVVAAVLLALSGTVFLANGTVYGADDAIRFAQHTAKAAGPATIPCG